MKKLLILSAAVLGAVACSNTYELKPAPEKAIGFGTWTETLTKARATANDNTAFQDGDAFDIYGFKTIGSDNHVVFNGEDNVTASVSSSTVTWDYSPHRFWDPAAASYTFFAVLPADKLATEASTNLYATTGQFASNDITFDDPTAFSNDILVANKTVVSGVGTAAPYNYSTVNRVVIDFNHIASCVDLKVKQDNALGNATVKVTALSLINIKNNGKFNVSSYDGSTYAPAISWGAPTAAATTLGTGGVYSVSGTYPVTVTGKTTYDGTSHVGTTPDTPASLLSGYVFMPQTLDGSQKIRLSYTIQVGSETPNEYNNIDIDLATFMTTDTDNNTGTAITSWNAGTHYTYYITIGASSIVFTANVNEWASTANGYRYLIN